MTIILPIILIIEIVFTLFILYKATTNLGCTYSLFCTFRTACNYFISLFENRNAFGVILTVSIWILSIPAVIIIIAVDIIMLVPFFCKKIWELGSRK